MSEPGRREVAHRLFAAEFDHVEFAYSEGDEERAPNYVVTPTGARINRLFTAGVLTEVEAVNENMLRARVVDTSGAFVTYAGQYQPDERAFLERANPPMFVGLTGKARTFEPDDADRIYSSVRPESINDIDATTRDRGTVGAAEATLDRLAVVKQALESDLAGDDLQVALAAGGAPGYLADGIPRALEYYGTTPAYVEAVRRLAVDALETVAEERTEVRSLDTDPDETEPVNIGPLPATDISVDTDAIDRMRATTGTETGVSAGTADEVATESVGTTESDTELATGETELSAMEMDSEPSEKGGAARGSESHTADEGSAVSAQKPSTESAADSSPDIPDETPVDDSVPELETETAEITADESIETTEPADDELGAFDDESGLGDFNDDSSEASVDLSSDTDSTSNPDSEPVSVSSSEQTETNNGEKDSAGGDETADSEASGEMYNLDEAERQQIEEEFDTGFSTGTEVDDAGEAGIEVPGPDELEEQLESEATAADKNDETGRSENVAGSGDDPSAATTVTDQESADDQSDVTTSNHEPTESEPEPDTTGSEEATESDSERDPVDEKSDSSAESVEDVDLEDAVVELMSEFDDGGGAPRDDIVAAAVDRHGADSGSITDAIEDALMSGKCYESGDNRLKPI